MTLRWLPFLLFAWLNAWAGTLPSPFTLYVHDPSNKKPDTPLTASYQFAATPEGGVTPLVLKMVNTSNGNVNVAAAIVAVDSSTPMANTNFSLTGLLTPQVLLPAGSAYFTVNFTPAVVGSVTGYLNIYFEVQQGGCVFNSGTCPNGYSTVSTLTGNATPPQLVLSYISASGPVVLQPASSAPLNFGFVGLGSSITENFVLSNEGTTDLTAPFITLISNPNAPNAFALDISQMPSILAAGASANLAVHFAPAQQGLANVTLAVGSSNYPLEGTGVPVAGVGSLQIAYTDSSGVRYLPQAATPISFGQLVAGSGANSILTFSLTNPTANYNSITIPSLGVTGTGFSLSGLPTVPFSIAPGDSITFKAVFAPNSAGTYTGTLSIGSLQFSLTGVSVASPLPGFTLQLSGSPSSGHQDSASVQFASASPTAYLGTIALQFAPSVSGVNDDPGVTFLATGGRLLSLTLPSGGLTALYNGQSSLGFQTGSTAGTITFTVTFPNTTPYTQSLTIPPTGIQITSIAATRQNPNLVVTMNGYDNTYSAGPLSFTFSDTSGNVIGSPVTLDATANFKQLFFSNNQQGGLFSLQATFPVTGDVTKVGSVAVSISNSTGPTTTSATFQ